MAPKGNAKAEAGRAAKEEVKKGKNAEKQKIVDKKEDEEWNKGAKASGAKEDKASKAAELAAKKAELARLTKLEEDSQPTKIKSKAAAKPKPLPPAKKVVPGTSTGPASTIPDFDSILAGEEEVSSFSASGIDNALEMMSLVNEKMDKASVGSRAAIKVEQHPERRFKAAFEAYKEEQLPIIRQDRPGMRLQQYHDALKSPDNPFNQVSVNYDATKEDKVAALMAIRAEAAQRLRSS